MIEPTLRDPRPDEPDGEPADDVARAEPVLEETPRRPPSRPGRLSRPGRPDLHDRQQDPDRDLRDRRLDVFASSVGSPRRNRQPALHLSTNPVVSCAGRWPRPRRRSRAALAGPRASRGGSPRRGRSRHRARTRAAARPRGRRRGGPATGSSMTSAMVSPTHIAELAVTRSSSSTICGRIATRAGRKNIETEVTRKISG